MLTAWEDWSWVIQGLAAGVQGWVHKGAAETALVADIRVVAQGHLPLDGRWANRLERWIPGVPDSNPAGSPAGLTDRETTVLRFTAPGYTSQEIGERLGLSPKTVETYRARAMEKLGVIW